MIQIEEKDLGLQPFATWRKSLKVVNERQTGRTTEMLISAFNLLFNYQDVIIIAGNSDIARFISQKIDVYFELLKAIGYYIKVIGIDRINSLYGLSKDTYLKFDHTFYEFYDRLSNDKLEIIKMFPNRDPLLLKLISIKEVGDYQKGIIKASYNFIIKKLGEPNCNDIDDPDKVKASWGFQDESGRKGFVWCWKYSSPELCLDWSTSGDRSLLQELFGDLYNHNV